MFINGTGMICAVGRSSASACAAKRAGISALGELPYRDNAGEMIVGAAVPEIAWSSTRTERLLALLAGALEGLLRDYCEMPWQRVPLLIGLAEPGRPGGGADLAPTIVRRVEEVLGIQFHPKHSGAVATGHTACFEALNEARTLLQSAAVPACIVCGVDSLVNAATLLWLDRDFRLKTSANRDGVVPGEGAAAVILEMKPAKGTATEVIGLGFGRERAAILSEEPLMGQGLTQAARSALAEAQLGLHEIDVRLSDVTGELYGFKELPLVAGRLMRVVRHEKQPLWHWAEAIGDTGAAAGACQLAWIDQAFRRQYAPGRQAICLTSGVAGSRASVVVRCWRT